MKELKYYKSKRQVNRDRIASSVTIILSIFLIFSSIIGEFYWIKILFCFLLLVGLYQFFDSFLNKPKVILNRDGIYTKANNTGLIQWKYINEFSISKSYKRFSFLVAEINDVEMH